MITILAMSMGGPLMLMFGITIALALGCAAGYLLGTALGRTRPATPLPTTVQVTREHLASTCAHLEKASARLNAAQRGELAGHALVLARRISDLGTQLGRIGHKARRQQQEGSA